MEKQSIISIEYGSFQIANYLIITMYEPKERSFDARLDKLIKQIVDYGKGQIQTLDYAPFCDFIVQCQKLVNEQPTLLDLFAPIKIVGSVHGHFESLIKIFQFTGWPSEVSYLFLGNYVDYGSQSLETMIFLLLLKIKYPSTFFLLKGCHETPYMNKIYGFYSECKEKYGISIWKSLCQVFACLPYAAIIDRRIFCVSGGISPELENLRQIDNLDRGMELSESLETDLLFSDPDKIQHGYSKNLQGYGVMYGRDCAQRFLAINGIQLICRSRQVVEEGYQFLFDRKLLNLFSAPNFMGKYNNSAAVLAISNDLNCEIQVYKPKKAHHTSNMII